MTIGVTLNDKHCYDDYGMWLTDVDISQPEVQTHYVQVPGRDGELDLTEALTGDVRYYNGTTTMTFQTAEKVCGRSWFEQLELIREDLHGKRATVMFDGTAVEYSGRCEVSGTPTAGGIYEIQVAVTVDGSETVPAFAFYSADDDSLNFYCGHVPAAGESYKGKTVTTVYENVENTGSSNPGWYSKREDVKRVMINSSFSAARPTSCYRWFYDFSYCTAIDGLSNLNTSSVTTMYYMFYRCYYPTTLDVSNWDTSSVTSMSNMFQSCNAITTLDVSNWDTSSVTSMANMFQSCSSLTTLDVSGFDTSSVTTMANMFYGCNGLTTIYSDDNNFVTTNVTSGSSMFYSCNKLVGGNGTKYSSSNATYTMAHIDTDDNPGYFTGK